jgi:hypothetical protein
VFTAFAVVLGTLVVQGLTLRPLLQALNRRHRLEARYSRGYLGMSPVGGQSPLRCDPMSTITPAGLAFAQERSQVKIAHTLPQP